MGKTPKKAAPGGDERNLYVRRLKATTAPSRASESSLHERQRESESLNRPKLTGVQKKVPAGPGKNFKSKLRPPTKGGLNQASKQLKLSMKNPEAKTADMQGSEEAEVKLNVSIQKENIKEENGNKVVKTEESATDKECVDHIEQASDKLQTSIKTIDEIVSIESKNISQEKEGVSLENVNIATTEMEEDNDIKLTFDIEKSPIKNGEEKLNDKRPKDDNSGEELQDQLKNGINEKEEIQSEAQTDMESYSVDIVESTTSELSETSESISLNDTQKDKEKIDDVVNNEASVSYDSSTLKDSYMLKDVHVMLVRSDCVKDNSKLLDVSNIEGTPSQLSKDLSFGRTLRNISGRHSIGRSRRITLRERISPNSSLFVNTSDMSIAQDEGTESKILHYSSLLSDIFPRNGSPLDRKRKIETNWDSAKKQKTDDESSSLNTSINLVKGFVKPVLISTPKSTPYKFESTKLDISGINVDNNKKMSETTESTKKTWCVIM
ncbi:mediator of RNA polymerase II transcription subunit 12-like isoform X1 [Formica exsecta]|uniref:mediator of RNA polymerase II transcription subunit 12-like isoform X1 n=2 Tax=Formica exsecta TaxID=72781 RepID=UPI001142A86A|nr:mediator of RNA polymerase II transcription subunit 12-like isoform X1 [Formica exsecta]